MGGKSQTVAIHKSLNQRRGWPAGRLSRPYPDRQPSTPTCRGILGVSLQTQCFRSSCRIALATALDRSRVFSYFVPLASFSGFSWNCPHRRLHARTASRAAAESSQSSTVRGAVRSTPKFEPRRMSDGGGRGWPRRLFQAVLQAWVWGGRPTSIVNPRVVVTQNGVQG